MKMDLNIDLYCSDFDYEPTIQGFLLQLFACDQDSLSFFFRLRET